MQERLELNFHLERAESEITSKETSAVLVREQSSNDENIVHILGERELKGLYSCLTIDDEIMLHVKCIINKIYYYCNYYD